MVESASTPPTSVGSASPTHSAASTSVESNGSDQPPTRMPKSPKLRRKVPVADALYDLTAVQRLVEYFVVVSSKPRWEEVVDATNQKGPPASPRTENTRKSDRGEGEKNGESHREEPTAPPSHAEQVVETRQEPTASNVETERRNTPMRRPSSENIRMPSPGNRRDHTFEPKITARYPLEDHDDSPLNPMILQFCYPSGDVIVPSKTYHLPRVHHFVLTNEKGRKIYATCLTVFEEYMRTANNPWNRNSRTHESEVGDDEIEVSVDYRQQTLYLPKVLCLLSTWPYLTAFREYLAQIWRAATATNVMNAPIERYILNICREIPAPPPGAYEIQVSILDSTIRFWAPPAKLPIAYVALPFQILFECLDLEHILELWSALVMERKILLLSSQYSILTVCCEILCSLLFPMRWSHLYIPLMPKLFCPMLDAPVPYLCGLVRENWVHAERHVSSDTIVVDLDRNTLVYGSTVQPVPAVPARKLSKLRSTLSETVGHVFWRARGQEKVFREVMASLKKPNNKQLRKTLPNKSGEFENWRERLSCLDHAFNLAYTPDSPNLLSDTSEFEQTMWDRVQEAFLRFFVALMKSYRKFLSVPSRPAENESASTKPSFNRIGFLAAQKSENAQFLVEMSMTQQFDDFLTRRMYSPGEPDLVFFDQSIDAKLNRSKLKIRKVETPFLQSAKAHKELTKLDALEPSGDGLREYDNGSVLKTYEYKTWPETFCEEYFCEPRNIPKMISAEFDRQSLLVAKLRERVGEPDEEEDDILELYGAGYSQSPEVAAFTVFFFLYSSVVGRDWQSYAEKRRVERRDSASHSMPGEQREAPAEVVEAVLQADEKSKAEDSMASSDCVGDLSIGLCDSCPDESLVTLQSAIVYCGAGAQHMYTSLYKETVDQVAKLQRQLNDRDVEVGGFPEADDDIAEYEEAREVASAQLDLAFEALQTMNLRGLSADAETYLAVMEACGRCGDTQRALNLLEVMKFDGFAADSEVLACFVSAFAQHSVDGTDMGSSESVPDKGKRPDGADAYSKYIQRRFHVAKRQKDCFGLDRASVQFKTRNFVSWKTLCFSMPEDSTLGVSDTSSLGSEASSRAQQATGNTFLEWFSHQQQTIGARKERRRKKKRQSAAGKAGMLSVTDMLARQLELSESLLDFLYPDLLIDSSSDSCPHCSHSVTEDEVIGGWLPSAFQDFTTQCPKCCHRFVPRFAVSCSSPDFQGSQGLGTPLYCEFLSPWVIRKQLQPFVKGDVGVERMMEPTWREGTGIQSTLFWNLMVLFRRYRLPYTFLLQGSFEKNRLILPRKPTDM